MVQLAMLMKEEEEQEDKQPKWKTNCNLLERSDYDKFM